MSPLDLPRLTLLILACATVSLPAQGGRGGRRGAPPPALLAIDLDGDGELSSDEIDAAARSLLSLDKNGDGNLTTDELRAGGRGRGGPEGPGGPGGPGEFGGFGGPGGPGGMMGMPGMTHPVMKALDKDGDGELFEDEITDAAQSLDRLDTDGDDRVSAAEMQARMGGTGGFGGMGPGGPGGPGGMGRGGMGRGGQSRYATVPKPTELRPEDGAAEIADRAAFKALSYQGEEVMIDTHLAGLEFVKFQIEGADTDAPRLYFMNTKTFRAHPMFMSAIGLVDRGPFGGNGGSRMRGVLVYRPMLLSPAGNPGLYTFEFEPNDAFPYELIRVAYDLLAEHAPPLRGNLSYNLLPMARQKWLQERAKYDAGALPVFQPEDVYGDVGFLPLHQAEAFGRLRLLDLSERPTSRDIVLYKTLPNEMPRVAGVITAVRQTPLSHVNLRAVQDDVPNAYVAGAATDPRVTALLGKLVHYKVAADGFELREATAAEVEAHFAALRPAHAQQPPRDLSVKEIRPFAAIGFGDAATVGVKAANLATLRTFGLGDDRTPDGFAVPFACYDAFMKHNGLDEMARKMLATEDFQRDAATREQALREFRKAVRKGVMPEWVQTALTQVQHRFPAGTRIRCRSSTNNEDLPGFSGAGLYDSFTHAPDEGPLANTVRQVYASLWNFRAFEEREFHRIDHFAAAMGVVLMPSTQGERANGVAVTKDILYQGAQTGPQLYYVNAQIGDDLVTNPGAESVPEELLLGPRNPGTDRVVQRSNRVPAGQPVLTDAQRLELRRALRVVQARFAALYDKQDDPSFAMEIEFKVTADGRVFVKQARPWVE